MDRFPRTTTLHFQRAELVRALTRCGVVATSHVLDADEFHSLTAMWPSTLMCAEIVMADDEDNDIGTEVRCYGINEFCAMRCADYVAYSVPQIAK